MITRLMLPSARLRIARAYSTVSFPPASGSLNASSSEPPRRAPPRPPVEPTVFDGKASPREIHLRPGAQMRGMPPSDRKPKARAAPKKNEEGQSFTGPSRPRAVYTRPSRELPQMKNRIPLYVAIAALGVGAWGLFVLYATNNERLSSSVVRQVTFQLRNSPDVQNILGDHIRLADNWWGFGEPWIDGGINLMQGRIDLKFRMHGDKGDGTVYFTSIRPQASAPWRIVRYKLIADNGEQLRLEDKFMKNPSPAEPATQ